ncbi:MAG: hypothetical protein D6753_01140 [Planctomycetota bacterium]|nr:MAG: hypothetical protein D6753_01140 [Planctomycetota bacterium]
MNRMRSADVCLGCAAVGMLAGIDAFVGRGPMVYAGVLAAVWFVIVVVLLTRPPAIPELLSDRSGDDEQFVGRRDVIPVLPWGQRIRLALGAACGCLLLFWLTLTLFAA